MLYGKHIVAIQYTDSIHLLGMICKVGTAAQVTADGGVVMPVCILYTLYSSNINLKHSVRSSNFNFQKLQIQIQNTALLLLYYFLQLLYWYYYLLFTF